MTSTDILYFWRKGEDSITINPQPALGDFTVEDIELTGVESESLLYSSSLNVDLGFARSYRYGFIFLFSSLLFIVAMSGLFLHSKLTIEKTLLILIPLVVSFGIIFWVRSFLIPGCSSVTSMEQFIIICACFIFFMFLYFVTTTLLSSVTVIDCTGSKFTVFDSLVKCLFPVIFVIFQIWFWAISG